MMYQNTHLISTKHNFRGTALLLIIALYGCSESNNPGTAMQAAKPGAVMQLIEPGTVMKPDNPGAVIQPVSSSPGVRYTECPFDTIQETQGFRCGVLDTYENYEKTGPDARMIEVAFGIIPATTTPVAPDPIVVFIGGPGASSLAEFAQGAGFESYTTNRDLILVDQRGAGFSKPFLNCDIPEDSDDTLDKELAAFKACITDFEQQGAELSEYRSAVIAQDFKVLREALKIEQWNVYGESYGPIPGLLYADLDPQGVRSLIFDSSTDNQVDIALADTASFLDYITELDRQCATESECSTRLPDLTSTFVDTFRSLKEVPWEVDIPGNGSFLFDEYSLLEFAFDLDGTNYPGVLELLAKRDAQLLEKLSLNSDQTSRSADDHSKFRTVQEEIERRQDGANLMGALVQCAAIDIESYGSASIPTSESWPDDLLAFVRKDTGEDYQIFCNKDVVAVEQDLSQRAPRFLDVPTLILGGGLDPIVSLKQVKKLTESFKSPTLAVVPKGDHVVGYPNDIINPCVKSVVTAFLDNPQVSPDTNCLTTNIEPFVFDENITARL